MSNLQIPHINNADAVLRIQYDKRPYWKQTVDFIVSLYRQALFSLAFLYRRVFSSNPQYCGQKIEWQSKSQGLVAFFHGICSDPVIWDEQRSLLHSHPEIDVFAPVVPNRGLCSLEEAVSPILPTILDYARKFPENPICLAGHSNGSRIATSLETELRRDAPQTPVMVSTIAGVHFGSSRMNFMENWGLAKYFYPYDFQKELKYGSPRAIELLEKVKAPLLDGTAPRFYQCFAATEDVLVPDLDSSLPRLDKGESFCVVHAHSHDSIVAAVAEQQVQACCQWISSQA